VKRTLLGQVVGVGLALAAGTATAQSVPAGTQSAPGAPAPTVPGTSAPANTVAPEAGQVTPAAQGEAAQEAAQPTQEAAIGAPSGEAASGAPLTLRQLVERARRTDAHELDFQI
jgi:hypothetical protein